MASFFSFFFVRLQSHSDWATFLKIETTKTTSIRPSPEILRKLVQKGPPFHILLFYRSLQNRTRLKGPPLQFFFGIVRLFFKNFLMYQKSPPFEFLIFCNKIYVDEAQRVPSFTFFGTMPLFLKEKIFKNFFEKFFLRFLSLRYSADFRRSRLVFFRQTTISL